MQGCPSCLQNCHRVEQARDDRLSAIDAPLPNRSASAESRHWDGPIARQTAAQSQPAEQYSHPLRVVYGLGGCLQDLGARGRPRGSPINVRSREPVRHAQCIPLRNRNPPRSTVECSSLHMMRLISCATSISRAHTHACTMRMGPCAGGSACTGRVTQIPNAGGASLAPLGQGDRRAKVPWMRNVLDKGLSARAPRYTLTVDELATWSCALLGCIHFLFNVIDLHASIPYVGAGCRTRPFEDCAEGTANSGPSCVRCGGMWT